MQEILYKDESYQIIGFCMEVHKALGPGFLEVLYKDALEYEFSKSNIPFDRERKYEVRYKEIVLPHYFYADFIVFDQIILEVKCATSINDEHIAQCINYLKASSKRLAILVNFGTKSLTYKRIVL